MRWGPFDEKGDGHRGVSMTRIVAFMFAVVYCAAVLLSAKTTATSMGWPFAALGVVVVLAVPLQALFRTIQKWMGTPSGSKLLESLLDKVGKTTITKVNTGDSD